MTYELEFKKSALKEWKKLGATVQTQLKKKLAELIENPHILPNYPEQMNGIKLS